MVVSKQSRESREISLRHVWLASLGAAVVARREARNAVETAVGEAGKLRSRASGLAAGAGAIARGSLMTMREQIEPKIGRFSGEVEARLAPVLEKIGLRQKLVRPVRKAHKAAARKPSRRPATARRKADLRIVRKGR